MGNENSQPEQPNDTPNPVAETARNIFDKIASIFKDENEQQVDSDGEEIQPRRHIVAPFLGPYPDENWMELFDSLPLEILYAIFYYLELNFKNVISIRLVSKKWSNYIFSRIPMDLDASFISFRRLSFLPLISGLKVAGFGLSTASLEDIMNITSLEKLHIAHDKAGQVSPTAYAKLRKLVNLRDLALVNLHSLPSALDLADLESLNKLEISGIHAKLKIKNITKLTSLKNLILMRQGDQTLLPPIDIGRLTSLEYLHLIGLTNSEDLNGDQLGLERMKYLKTLKLAAEERHVALPDDFYGYILHVEQLSLTTITLPKMATLSILANIKQLILYDVKNINQDEVFLLPNLEILKITFGWESNERKLNFKPESTEKSKKLRELVLGGCTFSETVCKAITKLPNLEYLSVPGSSDLSLQQVYDFAGMQGLRTLNLSYNVSTYWVTERFYADVVARAKTLRTMSLNTLNAEIKITANARSSKKFNAFRLKEEYRAIDSP